MKVIATKKGYHCKLGKLCKPGDVFEVDDDQPLGSWMEEVKEPKKRGPKPKSENKTSD